MPDDSKPPRSTMERPGSISDGRPRPDQRDRLVAKSPTPKKTGTPVHGTEIQRADYHAREARDTAQVTLNELGAVRTELRGDIGKVNSRLDGVVETVSDLRDRFGGVEGKLEILVGRDVRRDERETLTVTAEVEINKHEKLADITVDTTSKLAAIEDGKEARRLKRNLILQFATAALSGGAITALLALLASKC